MKPLSTEHIRILKKLLTGSLSPKERGKLNTLEFVEHRLQDAWIETSDIHPDKERKERMFANIMRQIKKQPKENFIQRLSKYGWAVSFLLLMICGTLTTILLTGKPTVVWYVVNSGRQSMDSVRLADGTLVMLAAGSRLQYPKEFTGDTREVTLSGQAYFRVHTDKEHPFIVNTQKMNVIALGTAFEVFSFDADKEVETILLSGKVCVKPKDSYQKIKGEYILKPNQKLSYRKDGTVKIESVDAESYSAWHFKRRLSFSNQKLSMILPRLEKWYGQKINCPAKLAEYYRFTFTLKDESLDQILNMISHNTRLTYQQISEGRYAIGEAGKTRPSGK